MPPISLFTVAFSPARCMSTSVFRLASLSKTNCVSGIFKNSSATSCACAAADIAAAKTIAIQRFLIVIILQIADFLRVPKVQTPPLPSPRPIPARRRPAMSLDTPSLHVEASPCHSIRHLSASQPRHATRLAIPPRRSPPIYPPRASPHVWLNHPVYSLHPHHARLFILSI